MRNSYPADDKSAVRSLQEGIPRPAALFLRHETAFTVLDRDGQDCIVAVNASAAFAKRTSLAPNGLMIDGRFRELSTCSRSAPVLRLAGALRSVNADLQPLKLMVAARVLIEITRCAGRRRRRDKEHRDRQHIHQGAARRIRRKSERSARAIGRSRGG